MFNIDNSISAVSTGSTRLKGNHIHRVKLVKVENTSVGKDTKYDVLTLTFEALDGSGTFTDTIFPPNSNARTANNFGGENPSPVEEFQIKMRQYIAALCPKNNAKIEKGELALKGNSWGEFSALLVKVLKEGVDSKTETDLKLIVDKKGNVRTPSYLAGLTKEGKLYPRNQFVGQGVKFTTNEVEYMAKLETAKPTSVEDVLNSASNKGSEDLSLKDKDLLSDDMDLDLDNL